MVAVRAVDDIGRAVAEAAADGPVVNAREVELADAAVASGDAHAVKLVEACRRGLRTTGDPVFTAAAERVVRRTLRAIG